MEVTPIPRPFEGLPRTPMPDNPAVQLVQSNGQRILMSVDMYPVGSEEVHRLPSGDAVHVVETKDPDTQVMEKFVVLFITKDGMHYACVQDESGIHYTKYNNGEPDEGIKPQEFIAEANRIVGQYDPQYTTTLGVVLAASLVRPPEHAARTTSSQRLQLVTDGKAAILTDTTPGHVAHIQHAFVNAKEWAVPEHAPNFDRETREATSWGNTLTPEQLAKLPLPVAELAALKKAIAQGGVTLEIEELKGNPVCRVLTGAPQKNTADPCKEPPRR